MRGLRIHQRKCGRNSSSASDAPAMESSLLAVHQSSDGPVQHHNAVMWGYALTHGETKRPSALNDLQLRPRLKLPNSTDKKKWKSLDEEIYTRTVSTFSNAEWRRGRVADLLPRFTDIVYESAASKFGTVDSKAQANPAQGEHKRQPRLLRKLKAAKKAARKEFRRVKRNGGDFQQAHAFFMKAVRTHHDLLKR